MARSPYYPAMIVGDRPVLLDGAVDYSQATKALGFRLAVGGMTAEDEPTICVDLGVLAEQLTDGPGMRRVLLHDPVLHAIFRAGAEAGYEQARREGKR